MLILLEPQIECIKYRRIADFTRLEGSGSGKYCDTNETAGWTRFVDQSGTAIISEVPQSGLRPCGGSTPGWFFGFYPSKFFSTTVGTMCYASSRTLPCAHVAAKPVKVTHCGDFFVFDMPIAPECPLRACTIYHTIIV